MEGRPAGWWKAALLLACMAALPLAWGCRGQSRSLVIAGSTSVQPVMEKIVEAFHRRRPEVRVAVEGGGSSAGITAVLAGAAHLGMVSRALKTDNADEARLKPFPIALDAIAVIVHPANQIQGLTMDQLRGLFTGRLRSWKDVGGTDRAVHLIVREEGSGTRGAFDEMVMKVGREHLRADPYALVQDSSGGLREVVAGDPDAIGFVSLGAVGPSVKALALDGVRPSLAAVRAREYALVRPFSLISLRDPEGLGREILNFTLGTESAEIMRREGLVSVGN